MNSFYVFCDKCQKRDKKIVGTKNLGKCKCGGEFKSAEDDLTIINYTANRVPEQWRKYWTEKLLEAAGDLPIISVSQKPIDLGTNICVGDIGCSSYNIYKQMLIGAKAAKTKYVALAEDDTLYSHHHFHFHRPHDDTFAYDLNKWSIYTWTHPALFHLKRRKTCCTMIAPRELLIETLEERFKKYPDPNNYPRKLFGEPGRNDYEKGMGVKERKAEEVYSIVSNIVFSHPNSEDYMHVKTRKALGQIRVPEICDWGTAEYIQSLYK
jgi:hypothetical protein